jgi:hypothetical protein
MRQNSTVSKFKDQKTNEEISNPLPRSSISIKQTTDTTNEKNLYPATIKDDDVSSDKVASEETTQSALLLEETSTTLEKVVNPSKNHLYPSSKVVQPKSSAEIDELKTSTLATSTTPFYDEPSTATPTKIAQSTTQKSDTSTSVTSTGTASESSSKATEMALNFTISPENKISGSTVTEAPNLTTTSRTDFLTTTTNQSTDSTKVNNSTSTTKTSTISTTRRVSNITRAPTSIPKVTL